MVTIAGVELLPQALVVSAVGLVFVFAACIGSFLNVVIYRLPIMLQRQWQQEARAFLDVEPVELVPPIFNLAFPRSACPACNANIPFWHNIPLLSYVLLLGKCSSCHHSISIRYPLVELATAVLSVILLLVFGLTLHFAALLILTFICIALFGIDADQQLLPDALTLPLLWIGLLINTQSLFTPLHYAIWGCVLGYGILWSIFWVFKLLTGKEGMGYGDFKLLAAFGAWFGWMALPNIILLSSLLGSIVGIILIWRNGKDAQTPIAFGPYIIIAAWLTVVFPQYANIINYFR